MRKEMQSGAFWAVVQKWGSRVTGLATLVVLTRTLEPRDFGLVAIAISFTSLLNVFVDFGASTYVVQAQNLDDETLDATFWANMAFATLLALALCGFAPLIATGFGLPDLTVVLRLLSVVLVLNALSGVHSALLRRALRMKGLTIRFFVSNAVAAAVAVVMAFRGAGVMALVAQSLVAAALGVVLVWHTSAWRPGFRASRAKLREVLTYGASISGTSLTAQVEAQGLTFLIGGLLGPVALGYYAITGRLIGTLLDLTVRTLGAASMPVFALYRNQGARLARGYLAAVDLTSALAGPAAATLAGTAPTALLVVFGAQWEPAVGLAALYAAIGVLQSFTYFDRPLLLARDRQRTILAITALDTSVVLLLAWGATTVGVVGVVAVRGLVLAVTAFIQARAVTRHSNVLPSELWDVWWRNGLLSAVVGLAAAASTMLTLSAGVSNVASLFASLTFAGAVWLLLVRWTSPRPWRELRTVLRNIARRSPIARTLA